MAAGTVGADASAAFWIKDCNGVDFLRNRPPKASAAPTFNLHQVHTFRTFGSAQIDDVKLAEVEEKKI